MEKSNLADDSKYNVRHELEIKRVQFNTTLAAALALSLSATVSTKPEAFRIAIPSQTFDVDVRVVNATSVPVTVLRAGVGIEQQARSRSLRTIHRWTSRFSVTVPANSSSTKPYFSRPDIEQSYYEISDERYLGLPATPYPYVAHADLVYEDAPVRLSTVIQTAKRVNGLGTVLEPLVIGPAISVSIAPNHGIVPIGAPLFPVTVSLHSNVKGKADGAVRLNLPAGWKAEPESAYSRWQPTARIGR